MRLSSIQQRLGVLFTGFALLIIISVVATFFGLNAQSQDSQLINLAGRQRMLAQQMARLALQIERSGAPQDRDELLSTLQTFDATLLALQQGGPAPYQGQQSIILAAVDDQTVRSLLAEVASTWAALRPQLLRVQSPLTAPAEFNAAQQYITQEIPALVRRADRVVQRYEVLAEEKVLRLRRIQVGFLAAAAGLLALSAWVTRRSIIAPLQALKSAAESIAGQATGEAPATGGLDTPVAVPGPDEIARVAGAMEIMRGQLQHNRDQLRSWATGLEQRVAQRTQELDALNAVSQEIAANLEVGQVLSSVTQKTNSLLKGDAAFLCLLDESGATLHLHAASGAQQAIRQNKAAAGQGFADQVMHADGAVRWNTACQGECQIMAARYRASQLAAPLRCGDRQIGALCVGSQQPEAFAPETENLLTRLANSASLALNNAHLYAQTERTAALEERQRMAGEIHDGLTQTILFLRLMGERLAAQLAAAQFATGQLAAGQPGERSTESQQTLQRMLQAIDQAEQEARSAIDSLQESFSSALILQEQLAHLAEQTVSEGVSIGFVDEMPAPFVQPRQETEQVLRVVKEALVNAQRHSQAHHITLRLRQEGAQGVVVVEDRGRGFDPQAGAPADGRQHFGLKIMQARAARLHGQLKIESQAGKGTCVTLAWPLSKPQAPAAPNERFRKEAQHEQDARPAGR